MAQHEKTVMEGFRKGGEGLILDDNNREKYITKLLMQLGMEAILPIVDQSIGVYNFNFYYRL